MPLPLAGVSPAGSPLRVVDLRWTVPPGLLGFETTEEVAALEGIIGQASGLAALRRGVELPSVGFNVFVVGLRSTGRLGTVRRIVEELAPKRRATRDLVYVHNFTEASRPRLLVFPPGRGLVFRKEMVKLAARLVDLVPAILGSADVRRMRERQEESAAIAHHGALAELEAKAHELGFAIVTPEDEEDSRPLAVWVDPKGGTEEHPSLHGRAELQVLAKAGRLTLPMPIEELMARFDVLEERLGEALSASRVAVDETVRKVAAAEEEAIRAGTQSIFTELARSWPAARAWLAELQDELVCSPEWFDEEEGDRDALFQAFTANVVHAGSRSRRAPIVVAPNPTWQSLLGGIEGEPGNTDHRAIRGGALLDADGGFLVLNAADLLQEPGAWKVLKRALTYGEFEIQNPESPMGGSAVVLRPEPMRLDIRVLLLGDPTTYAMMYYGDPDFASIFKIKAEFEDDTPINPDVLLQYVSFCSRLVRKEGLPHLHREAIELVLEWSVRQSGRGGRISTRFGPVADLIREAAIEAGGRTIQRVHVQAALDARRHRDDLPERRVLDAFSRGDIRVDTDGRKVGQVNGLAVYHVGGHDFGRPLRITATVGVGRGGVVSIERESGLSGRAHDKGVQILTGIIRESFGQTRTLAFTASLCFEQSYGRIDGDSASSAEVYALLSALSGVPLRQDLAVTGSINQFGDIQAIGGVNEKIEGFYAACRIQGLSGNQGVIIPRHNVLDLCLSPEVSQACAEGRFAVWAIDRFEEGITLLTGLPAGVREADPAGAWTPDSVFARVAATLDRYQDVARLQGKSKG